MTDSDQIRTATWDDEATINALIPLSFAADPFVRWILPDPHNFIKSSETYARRSTGPAFDHGSIYLINDKDGVMSGAALWLPPGITVDHATKTKTPNPYINPLVEDDFAGLIAKAGAYRPTEPHWYLSLIVVDPAKRGNGYGAALMTHALEIIDRDKKPAYLESTNAANLTLYKRFGFELLDEVQYGNSPLRYPMLRKAR